MTRLLSFSFAVGLALIFTGCGGGPDRQLQSITIAPQSGTAQNGQSPQFTATGQFNVAPMTQTPLPVSWMLRGPGIDIPGPGYQLSASPVSFTCIFPGTYVVVAFAPMDPKAPSSGPMSSQVWDDIAVNHITTSEGGFVGSTAQFTCP